MRCYIRKKIKIQFTGGIRNKNSKIYLSKLEGDYSQNIFINGEKYWDINTMLASRPNGEINENEILLPDSRYRLDRYFFIDKETEYAEVSKKIIEDTQRREEKLRKK